MRREEKRSRQDRALDDPVSGYRVMPDSLLSSSTGESLQHEFAVSKQLHRNPAPRYPAGILDDWPESDVDRGLLVSWLQSKGRRT